MNKIREVIRLKEQCNLSKRAIARTLSISRPVVSDYLNKIKSAGIDYSMAQKLDDDTLTEIIEGTGKKQSEPERSDPEFGGDF